jgi:energy-coupling factor transporter ATP-binding protein EcfA2
VGSQSKSTIYQVVEAINGVFNKYSGMAAVLYKHPKTGQVIATIAYTYVGMPVFTNAGVDYTRVTSKHQEIRNAVGRVLGGRVMVRFGDFPFSIEVPRKNPVYTELALPARMKPFHAILGRAYTYGKEEVLKINLTDPNESAIFVAGQPGCGKSNLLEGMLLSLANSTSPDLLSVYLIDMKKRSLSQLDGLPHVVDAGYDEDGAYRVCKKVFDELIERRDNANIERRSVLFIDELRELKFGSAEILGEWLPRIVALGREIGINVVAATQKPNAEDLGPIVNAMFTVRIAGVVESPHASYHTLKRKGAGAENLLGRGDMLVSKIGSEPVRMQAYRVLEMQRYVDQVTDRWPGAVRRAPAAVEEIQGQGEGGNEFQKNLAAAREVWPEVYDPTSKNKLRFRGKTTICEAIFGKGVKLEGHYHRVTEGVIKHLLTEVE